MCATLADVWKGGGPGALSPLTQVRVWALRDAYVDTGAKAHGLPVLIATKVTKVGGGRPEAEVVRRLLARIDDDPDWHPGNTYGGKAGRAKALSSRLAHRHRGPVAEALIAWPSSSRGSMSSSGSWPWPP